mgnify:CR=1 FL=1
MVGSGLQLDFVQRCFPGYSHGHAAFPVRLTRLFAHVLCNSPYGLRQTQNIGWQCAPHDGSLATVCGNSRGSSVVRTGNHKIKMPLIFLSDTFYLTSSSSSLQIILGNLPRTALESVYPSELPPMMKSFFLCYGDETPGSVEPSGEHASCFGEVHRNAQHKETWNHWRELAEHSLFLTRLRFHREFHQNTMLLLHTLLCHILQICINKNIDLTI